MCEGAGIITTRRLPSLFIREIFLRLLIPAIIVIVIVLKNVKKSALLNSSGIRDYRMCRVTVGFVISVNWIGSSGSLKILIW